jgi:hypothetical protein
MCGFQLSDLGVVAMDKKSLSALETYLLLQQLSRLPGA